MHAEQDIAGMRSRVERVRSLRRAIEEAIPPQAFSTDGQRFTYQAPLSETRLPVGGYVTMQIDADTEYLGQIITQEIAVRQGPELGFDFDAEDLGFSSREDGASIQLSSRTVVRTIEGEGIILGTLVGGQFTPAGSEDIFPEVPFRLATDEEAGQYLSDVRKRVAALDVGQALFAAGEVPASLSARGFNRHTFLCGQSGSGKTFSLGIIVEQLLLETDLKLVIIDPNSDFVRLNELHSLEAVNRARYAPLSAAAHERMVARYQDVMRQVRILRPAACDGCDALQIRFSDLSPHAQATVLQLDPLADREEFNTFGQTVDRMSQEHYSISAVRAALANNLTSEGRQLALRIENLGIADWEVWSQSNDAPSFVTLLEGDWRCLVIDVGTLSLPAEKSVVVHAALSYFWRNRHRREPVLIVIDEAHNVCPQEPEDNLTAMTADYGIRIAGEGRKFGLYLLLASQRPAKIHTNVLSQCDNLILMRMNSKSDLEHIKRVFSHVPDSLLSQAAHFGLGESLVAGSIIQHPTFVKFGGRLSHEGGGDVPTSWAAPESRS